MDKEKRKQLWERWYAKNSREYNIKKRIKDKDRYNKIKNTKEYLEKKRIQQYTRRNYPKAKKCEICDSDKNVQHHHPKPYNGDIFINVCQSCHRLIEISNGGT